MHVILTHEQADFDALGALLGAALLSERAVPVLPRRTNRNVRAFLTLYGAELPFVEPRDLPEESIELITLVDTQSLITLKGMSQATRVHVVDQSPGRRFVHRFGQARLGTTPEGGGATCIAPSWRTGRNL